MQQPNRLLRYLPDVYRAIKQFRDITNVDDAEITRLDAAIEKAFNDQFILTSSEEAIARRERMLKIKADPTKESLDFRKMRLINRYSTKPPFTRRYLQQRLDFLLGPGRATLSVDSQNFLMTISTSIGNAAVFKEVQETVAKIKPTNMVYQQQTSIESTLEFEEHISKRTLERKTGLSTTWRLGITPFAVASEEVVIK